MPRLRNREVNRVACVFSDTPYTFLDGFSRQVCARGLSIENGQSVSKRTKIIFSSRAIFRREGEVKKIHERGRENFCVKIDRDRLRFWWRDRYLYGYPAQSWKSQSHDSHVGSHMTIKSHLVSGGRGAGKGAWLYEARSRIFFFFHNENHGSPTCFYALIIYRSRQFNHRYSKHICALSRVLLSYANKRHKSILLFNLRDASLISRPARFLFFSRFVFFFIVLYFS